MAAMNTSSLRALTRALMLGGALCFSAAQAQGPAAAAQPLKVLRYAFLIAETTVFEYRSLICAGSNVVSAIRKA